MKDDLTIESFRNNDKPYFAFSHRIAGVVKDAPATTRTYQPTLVNHDSFLAYLEWKMDRPWYKRFGLP